jgi:hypothetical protein
MNGVYSQFFLILSPGGRSRSGLADPGEPETHSATRRLDQEPQAEFTLIWNKALTLRVQTVSWLPALRT